MKFPLVVGVSASKSKAGKTTFIENFIRFVKKKYDKTFIIALKYSKSSLYSSIITEPFLIEVEGKDTERMKKAGADFVCWVRARKEDLEDIAIKLNEIINGLNKKDRGKIVIIEGNSLVTAMQPNVIIFFKNKIEQATKASGKIVIQKADLIIEGDYSMEQVMRKIENIQQKKLIENSLKERSNDGKITCAEARKIAEELNVPYIEVGRVANELNIKIRKCDLGCF